MAQILTTDGKMHRIELDQSPERRVQQLQEAVGGYIELAGQIEMGACVFANEKGRLLNLPPNRVASELLDQLILGDVVVLSATEVNLDVGNATFH